MPSSDMAGVSGPAITGWGTCSRACFFTTGGGPTTMALGGAHELRAQAAANNREAVKFDFTVV